jgi:hypothetical protein
MSPLTGYNSPIPNKTGRERIKYDVVMGSYSIMDSGDGMVIFGSGSYTPRTHGFSDIDLVFFKKWDSVYSDKEWIREFGKVIKYALRRHPGFELDLNIIDDETAVDGRFCNVGNILTQISGENTVLYGDDFRDRIVPVKKLPFGEFRTSFKLRELRSNLAMAEHDAKWDVERLRKSFRKALKSPGVLTEELAKAVGFYDGDVEGISELVLTQERAGELFHMSKNPRKVLDVENTGVESMIGYIEAATLIYETVISEFIKRYPSVEDGLTVSGIS